MSPLNRELVFLILQFLDEEKFKESVHKLEQESGLFFNWKYFEEKAMLGEWDEAEKYISGFTNIEDNPHSMKIFFEIRKQKYFEALDRKDKAKAVEILAKELKVFAPNNEELYKEITQLLLLENYRENEKLLTCGDTKSVRRTVIQELRRLIEENPLFKEKLALPTFNASRLRTLINQSLNWQHQQCINPQTKADIKTLLTDHTCSPQSGAGAPTPITLPVAGVVKPWTYATRRVHGGVRSHSIQPFQPSVPALNANALAGWMANIYPSFPFPMQPNQVAMLNHPWTLSNPLGMIDYQSADREKVMFGPTGHEVTYPTHSQPVALLNDLPRRVVSTMRQGSVVISMDFHPFHHTFLTVGCSNGEVTLWEVGTGVKVVTKPFKIWDMAACSVIFQGSVVKDPSISVSRVSWSPHGNMIGVAFTKHLIQVYAYQGSDIRQHLEMDAHVGCVNDLAFALPNEQPCVVTCGDDKLIKVWDLSGKKLYTFEGHDAPVYSICPQQKENISFILSTALDGKIKGWFYNNNTGSRGQFVAPGQWCTTMLYSDDGSRLFSCGTSKDGESFLVEWDENKGAIKRTYVGFRKKSPGVVQFDTAYNRFLAVGEDNQVKFWDMDSTNLLTTVEADGGLPSLPRLRFNKRGNLLAVTTAADGFKILANADGLRILRDMEASTRKKLSTPTVVTSISPAHGEMDIGTLVMPARIHRFPSTLEVMEIADPSQCRQVTMTDCKDSVKKVARILYTNSGDGILALGTNGVQRLWKWSSSEQNRTGKATVSVAPQHWQPESGLLMTNDVPDNPERSVPCLALSNNDSYVISACGGNVSMTNMKIFKVMATFMQAPPASTFLAFHPQDNNIIAVGMEDSTICIYNVKMVVVLKARLKGHQKHITGLAFSGALKLMVSAGADAQLCFWSVDSWEMKNSLAIQLPGGMSPIGKIRVQFHTNQLHLLVSHETQIAIYDCLKMECIQKWMPQESLSSPITSAYYSCDSQLVYASFADGNIGVFEAEYLRLKCRIAPSAYMPQQPTPNSAPMVPLVITAHPQERNQIAVGLSDGSVKVLETPEPFTRCGVADKPGTWKKVGLRGRGRRV